MVSPFRVIDNNRITVADHLRRHLDAANSFDFVSAYFSIYGYQLLADELDCLDQVRFLFGDPTSVEDLDPGDRDPKSFDVTEKGMVANHTLHQKPLAERCAAWMSRDSVSIRSITQANFLHGKMYLSGVRNKPEHGLVGSSNFTKSGLGGSERPNLEINLATYDETTLVELQDWFDSLWKDEGRTENVKQKVLEALERVGRDHPPELIYYKTLYELFRQEIEARLAGEEGVAGTGFYDSQIWNALYQFQKDGALGAIARLREHNGCIVADSVGLGKTYTALAVIKYFEQINQDVLVLCPSKLKGNWSLYQVNKHDAHNPFPQDRFGYALLAHTDLSRTSGNADGINLENFHWGSFGLVVIDESHNFRNSDGKRYEKLLEDIIKVGPKTKVLMLSATPVNTSLMDLRNQIYLMTEGRDQNFQQSLNVGNIGSVLAVAQREFQAWETDRKSKGGSNKERLLEKMGSDFKRLLGGLTIARSRRLLEESYADEMKRIGQFPDRAEPVNSYPPTDLHGDLSYSQLANRIEQFKLSVYQPSAYVTDPERLKQLEEIRAKQNFNQRDSERFLVGMMRTNFLKRLESSAHSLTLTLERTIGKIDGLLEKIGRYQERALNVGSLEVDDVLPIEDEDDEDFQVNRGRNPYHLSQVDLPLWVSDLQQDRAPLQSVLDTVATISPERDGKLQEIRRVIQDKVNNPASNSDGKPNKKLLVFTTFKDTAIYLYNNLEDLANELDVSIAMVSGDETRTSLGSNTFNDILTNFSPISRNRSDTTRPEIDLLVATDCISEGQNLQDCDAVLNYDIHWNPVRLIQRFGRIDRIGSRNSAVHMRNFWPTEDMEVYLKLESRVQSRMALADAAATGSDNLLTEDGAQLELDFRNQQLLRLKEEVLTMDDLDESPSMSDFTLDHFIAQLLRYLEQNRDELEELPAGVYAVAPDGSDPVVPGVIFFLRQRNAGSISRNTRMASPVHPHYFVYIQDDGTIRYGCANARQILGVFETAAVGKKEPIATLCRQLDSATQRGHDMSHYDQLLNGAIAQIRQAHNSAQSSQLRPGGDRSFRFTPAYQAPQDSANFELVTWLVLMREN